MTKIYASSISDAIMDMKEQIEMGDTNDIGGFVGMIISFAVPLSVLSVFVLLTFSAYQLMTSRGNPDKLKAAQEQITNAIIGFLFVILSVAILFLLSDIIGIRQWVEIGGN